MSSTTILFSLLLLTQLIEVCPNPYGSDDAEYVKFYCDEPCILSDGEAMLVASPGYHIAAKNPVAVKQHFGIDADLTFPKGFVLSNRGEEVCVNTDCFYYGKDVQILDDGIIYYRTADGWDFRYEDWSNFSCTSDVVAGKLIITPTAYELGSEYIVASYTFAANWQPKELFVDASPPSLPCRELKIKNVNFLASNSYRNFHYKFAFKGEHVVITTENWVFSKKGYLVEFKSGRIAELLKKIIENDRKYSKPGPSTCTEWRVKPGYGGKEISFSANVTVFVLPDCNPIFDFISSAKQRLYIVAPYMDFRWYTSDKPLLEAIRAAKRNGAEVTVVLNDRYADRETVETLRKEGVRVALLSDLHGKAVVADNRLLVTSANFNMYGLKLNREVGVIIENSEVADFVVNDLESEMNFTPVGVLPPLIAFLVSAFLFTRALRKSKF